MSRYKKNLGDFGETVAKEYFEKLGCRILKRNYKVSGGELDLIAENATHLIFVEVKTRSNINFGYPAEAIDRKKMFHMRRAAERYLAEHLTEKEIRFDAVEVFAALIDGEPYLKEINHISDIVLEGEER